MAELYPPPRIPQASDKPPGVGGVLMRRWVLESPYGPSATETEPDHEFARGVLHAVRAGWEQMHKSAPDIYQGMTLYGGTVKGRIRADEPRRPGSDVDAYIFCDPDARKGEDIDRLAEADIRRHIVGSLRAAGYEGSILSRANYYVVDMNRRLLDQAIDEALRGAVAGDVFGHSWLGQHRIVPLFHLRTGSGNIRTYRQQVIDALQRHKDGERVWSEIMTALARKEEARRQATILLPSLDEAASYFL